MDLGILIPIVAIIMGISIPITAIKLKHRERIEQMRLAAASSRDDRPAARQDPRIDELEERVRVLERIVTDGGYDLAHKIEALRDERALDQRSDGREVERSN